MPPSLDRVASSLDRAAPRLMSPAAPFAALLAALLAAALAVACRTPAPRGAPVAATAPAAAPAAVVALVEWQFPTTPTEELRAHPLQRALAAGALAPAFYPSLSDANATDPPHVLGRLIDHATSTYLAYVAGRPDASPPFLLNISAATPDALRAVIGRGVRVVSFSTGSRSALGGLERVVREHPEVLFVVAKPHISGNESSVEELDEVPSILATRGLANVILAGCVEHYDSQLEAHRAGERLGTAANPFHLDCQPGARGAREVFLMSCASSRAFAVGFGGTSAAAPHLASLLELIVRRSSAGGRAPPASAILAELDRVLHATLAAEKTGEVREVRYFTLDTVLLAAGRPLVTDRIWRGLEHPAPMPLGGARAGAGGP